MTTAKKAARAKKASSSRRTSAAKRPASKSRKLFTLRASRRVFTPTAEVVALIGSEPLVRSEAHRRVLEYVKNGALFSEEASSKRVKLDAKLKAAFFSKTKGPQKKGSGGDKGDNPGPSISYHAFKRLLVKKWS